MDMEDVFENMPCESALIRIESVDIRLLQNVDLDAPKVVENLQLCYGDSDESHVKKLWDQTGYIAMAQNDLKTAQICFVRSQNYGAICWTQRMLSITDPMIRAGEINYFLEDFDDAETCFRKANRTDLCILMYKSLEAWGRVQSIRAESQIIHPLNETESNKTNECMGDMYREMGEWTNALFYYKHLPNLQKAVASILVTENYDVFTELAKKISSQYNTKPGEKTKEENLKLLADSYHVLGMSTDAAKLLLKHGMVKNAADGAVANLRWDIALQIAQMHNLSNVSTLLVQCVKYFIDSGNIMQAVQALKGAEKTIAAGKLLMMMGLIQLKSSPDPNYLALKKIFIMAAKLLIICRESYEGNILTSKSRKRTLEGPDNLNSQLNSIIPEFLQPSAKESAWMKKDPWRAAEAMHFVCLCQKLLYKKEFELATRSAVHLKSFSDILGEERIHAMIALCAANSHKQSICSKAIMNLESISDQYEDLSIELFSRNEVSADNFSPKDQCYGCQNVLKDFGSICSHCGMEFPHSVFTGSAILVPDLSTMWRCSQCMRFGTLEQISENTSQFCPLCHYVISKMN